MRPPMTMNKAAGNLVYPPPNSTTKNTKEQKYEH
jgi:hypothetical protein